MTDHDKIAEARRLIEEAGGEAIIWLPADFPGDTEEERMANMDANIKYVVDACIERGNQAIADLCA